MTFFDAGTEDIYDGTDSEVARKTLQRDLWRTAQRRLQVLEIASSLTDLKGVSLKLEALKEDRVGQHSIRINDQFRVCFRWSKEHQEPQDVQIINYH